ncbi:THUMP domain-containing protein 3 [Entomortierella beljakovae]|nr:THUMP domain-containing protein 3 [Entomortierella beljakovae]
MEKTGSIQLFLSVPPGLEDVAVRKLPSYFIKAANTISYRISTGYVTVGFKVESPPPNNLPWIIQVITDLVQRPPLCVFAAYISIGILSIPREIFNSSKDLLTLASAEFQQSRISDPGYPCVPDDLGLRWHEGLSVLKSISTPLAALLNLPSADTNRDKDGEMSSVRFRASFDRGDVQHKGVRSQDLAAGLGSVTGKLFSSWRVDLENYDIEIMARWIQEDLENVHFKSNDVEQDKVDDYTEDIALSNTGASIVSQLKDMRMQVGMTLPLALSACPYRYRPMDGRTSLKIEIAYTLLALSDPQPGNFIMDVCSGVGTVPIVGAANYPECFFAGVEFVPINVVKANENSKAMVEKVNIERSKRNKNEPAHSLISTDMQPLVRPPCLLLGDAKSVCWRTGTIDLIVSGKSNVTDSSLGCTNEAHVNRFNCY